MFDNPAMDNYTVNSNSADKVSLIRNKGRAESIILLARKKGEMIIKNAKLSAQQIKEQAEKEGFKKGFAEGLEAGQQKCKEEYDRITLEVVEKLKLAGEDYIKHIEGLTASLQPRILDLITVILSSILKQKVNNDDELVIRTVKEAIKNLTERDAVVISAHASQVDKIREHKSEILSASNMITDIEIYQDEEVTRGGCILSSQSGIIDARIESQLEVVSDVIHS